MAKIVCVTKCFFQSRLWSPGETLDFPDGREVPKFFKEKAKVKVVLGKEEEPMALSQLQKEEARAVLEGVGHGSQGATPVVIEDEDSTADPLPEEENAQEQPDIFQ